MDLIPSSQSPPMSTCAASLDMDSQLDCESTQVFTTLECFELDVLRVLSQMKSKTSMGPDGISATVLEQCGLTICGYLLFSIDPSRLG